MFATVEAIITKAKQVVHVETETLNHVLLVTESSVECNLIKTQPVVQFYEETSKTSFSVWESILG